MIKIIYLLTIGTLFTLFGCGAATTINTPTSGPTTQTPAASDEVIIPPPLY